MKTDIRSFGILFQSIGINVVVLLSFMFFCYIALYSLFEYDTWIECQEFERYQELIDAFREAFLAGKYYPRWLPEFYGGYGYPTFVYYQPGYFFLCLPLSLIFENTAFAMKLSVLILLMFSGFGTYLFAKEIVDKKTAVFLGFCFILTPYISVEIFVRGALSELTGMLLTPWPLYFLVRMHRETNSNLKWRFSFFGLTLSLFFIVISHPIVAMFYYPAFVLCAVYFFFNSKERTTLGVGVVLALFTGTIVSSPYWYGVLHMKPFVNFDALVDGYYQSQNHTVFVRQLFSRVFEFGDSIPLSSADTMSFQLGAPFFILAVLGFILNRKNNFQKLVFGIYMTLIFLMLNAAKPFWSLDMMTRFVQFPWRLLAIIGIFQIISMSGLSVLSKHNVVKKYYTVFLVVLFFGAYAWHSNQFHVAGYLSEYSKEAVRNNFLTYAFNDEFKPKTSKERPLLPRVENIMMRATNDVSIEPLAENNPHKIAYRVFTGAEKTEVTIQQLYFPGWEVFVNGKHVSDEQLVKNLDDSGLIRLGLPPNAKYEINASYVGVPGLMSMNVIVGIWLLFIIVFLLKFEYFNKRIYR
tara:strand:- start:649 stop:2385 length:1737 start_codon:yes stop_codon:yes gene_type:complete